MQVQATKNQVVHTSHGIKTRPKSVLARYNGRPEPSNCANFVKSRDGMYHIFEVMSKFIAISGLRINRITFPRDLLPEENFESSKRP